MINRIKRYLQRFSDMARINVAVSRAAATSSSRLVVSTDPGSWEFVGFSQNGEDGIIDFLTSKIKNPNRYFIEIGSSDGLENNTAWLAIAKKFSGLMIEGDSQKSRRSEQILSTLNLGVKSVNLFVNREDVLQIIELAAYRDPDVFCLDVDGVDYYIAEAIINAGLRPKIFVVEYNSAFGPSQALTVRYSRNFDFKKAHDTQLYYGVSICGWREFFDNLGYRFVTVEQNGVNAFFVNPGEFDHGFITALKGSDFRENFYQKQKWKVSWEGQFEMIKDMEFFEI
jgi:hypothetical protein